MSSPPNDMPGLNGGPGEMRTRPVSLKSSRGCFTLHDPSGLCVNREQSTSIWPVGCCAWAELATSANTDKPNITERIGMNGPRAQCALLSCRRAWTENQPGSPTRDRDALEDFMNGSPEERTRLHRDLGASACPPSSRPERGSVEPAATPVPPDDPRGGGFRHQDRRAVAIEACYRRAEAAMPNFLSVERVGRLISMRT